jgi:two component transcriptional regulator, winged helix family
MNFHSHLLIVEDDPVASATLAAYLEKEGYRVSCAPDGETMRRVFAKGDVDLILLDINLPDDDGFSLLREIRRQSEVGVIMVTGKGEEVDRIVALEMGPTIRHQTLQHARTVRTQQKPAAPHPRPAQTPAE